MLGSMFQCFKWFNDEWKHWRWIKSSEEVETKRHDNIRGCVCKYSGWINSDGCHVQLSGPNNWWPEEEIKKETQIKTNKEKKKEKQQWRLRPEISRSALDALWTSFLFSKNGLSPYSLSLTDWNEIFRQCWKEANNWEMRAAEPPSFVSPRHKYIKPIG